MPDCAARLRCVGGLPTHSASNPPNKGPPDETRRAALGPTPLPVPSARRCQGISRTLPKASPVRSISCARSAWSSGRRAWITGWMVPASRSGQTCSVTSATMAAFSATGLDRSTMLRSRPVAEKAAIVADVTEHVWPLLEAGTIHPVIHARLPLDQADRAHEMLRTGEAFGKVLLIP